MRIRCIACEALARIAYTCASSSSHTVDVELLELGLHKDPGDLRRRLQERVDATDSDDFGAVALVYGLCGQSTAGLTARHVPLVIPKAHDCITLFLGSREEYRRQHEQHPGTYWYSADYVERSGQDADPSASLGNASDTQTRQTYREFVEKYGEEDAAYLMETMGAWQKFYDRAAFIATGHGDSARTEAHARGEAERRGWAFVTIPGDMRLVRKLLHGEWDGDFVVLQPGQSITETYDNEIMGPRGRS
jgi:hypothetical protein